MAQLSLRRVLSLQDLEMQLGVNRLPHFIYEAEQEFLAMTQVVIDHITDNPEIRAVFVSGPTSSGKTTFAERLALGLREKGRCALRISLDDYYDIRDLEFDTDGRPDYESLSTIDSEMAADNIMRLINSEPVFLPKFNFQTRKRDECEENAVVTLGSNGILLVEGLHGLSSGISGVIPRSERVGVFIMPYGDIIGDQKLFRSGDIRLLRRIVRDERHRGAHALATIDYWPMIEASEKRCFDEYLAEADFYVNSFLAYETLVIAPAARADIELSLSRLEDGTIEPSVFLARTNPPKAFANLDTAVVRARNLFHDLSRIPKVDPKNVPDHSILQEFIGEL